MKVSDIDVLLQKHFPGFPVKSKNKNLFTIPEENPRISQKDFKQKSLGGFENLTTQEFRDSIEKRLLEGIWKNTLEPDEVERLVKFDTMKNYGTRQVDFIKEGLIRNNRGDLLDIFIKYYGLPKKGMLTQARARGKESIVATLEKYEERKS